MNWNGGVVIVVVIANFTSNPVNRPCAETLAANFDFSIPNVVLLDMMLPKARGTSRISRRGFKTVSFGTAKGATFC